MSDDISRNNYLPQIDAVAGAILGCAVGDALGLPYEGLSPRRGLRLLGEPDRHRFIFGRGMVSDDTEHTCLVAQALCEHPTDVDAYARALGWRLRWWLLGVPAGIGWATLRACVRLWLGFSPQRSGVFSAGNGPAMRTAILGAAIDDVDTLKRYVRATTVVTHTDPKAYQGALAVALAAWCAKRGVHTPGAFLERYHVLVGHDNAPGDEFAALMRQVTDSVAAGVTTVECARSIGCERGVSGYIFRTVPVALHAWLAHPHDYRAAVSNVIRCGGDTDTTAAIVGAIVGSGCGPSGIPAEWLAGLWERPKSVAWMDRLAEAVVEAMNSGRAVRPPRASWLVGLARNAVFLVAVVVHALRRLLPPY